MSHLWDASPRLRTLGLDDLGVSHAPIFVSIIPIGTLIKASSRFLFCPWRDRPGDCSCHDCPFPLWLVTTSQLFDRRVYQYRIVTDISSCPVNSAATCIKLYDNIYVCVRPTQKKSPHIV